jgi:hypothetical protein
MPLQSAKTHQIQWVPHPKVFAGVGLERGAPKNHPRSAKPCFLFRALRSVFLNYNFEVRIPALKTIQLLHYWNIECNS